MYETIVEKVHSKKASPVHVSNFPTMKEMYLDFFISPEIINVKESIQAPVKPAIPVPKPAAFDSKKVAEHYEEKGEHKVETKVETKESKGSEGSPNSSESAEQKLQELLSEEPPQVITQEHPKVNVSASPYTVPSFKDVVGGMNTKPTTQPEDENKKRELIFKLNLLKDKYKDAAAMIPFYDNFNDYDSLKHIYETSVKRLSIDSESSMYKRILVYSFMAIEAGMKRLGFNMDGYTEDQLSSMATYDRLLLELGEKSYIPDGSSWSVEVRLMATILFNTVIFLVLKPVLKELSPSIASFIGRVTVKKPEAASTMAGPVMT